MNEWLKPYGSLLKINFKNTTVYRADMALSTVLTLVSSLVFILVWSAVYYFSSSTAINGVALITTIAYFLVIGAVDLVEMSSLVSNMQNDLQYGNIATSLIRPMSYVSQLIMGIAPDMVILFCFGTVPIIVLVVLLGNFAPSIVTVLLFIAAILVGVSIFNLIGFIFGGLSAYLTNVWGVYSAVSWIFAIAGGGIAPLAFFPHAVTNALLLTPIPITAYVPAATILGMIPSSIAIQSIVVGLVWIVILALIAWFEWTKISKKLNAVGV
jgi:ABC-type uncharacterized transport system permease subunit